jgi:hypothetical protein
VQDEFEQFKLKTAREYESMQNELNQKAKKDLEAMKVKYEAMLEELRRNAAGDKEFV